MDKELVLSIARDLLLKTLEQKEFKLNLQSPDATINDLGDKFNLLVQKVSIASKSIGS